MTLDDCCTREFEISLLFFNAVDYGDLIPTSEELRHIIGSTQKDEKNQCVLVHLDAALAHSEVGSERSTPPASRVRLMAKGWRLLEANQARLAQDSIHQSKSRRCDELLSLFHDVLADSHDRDYRSLCIFPLGEFSTRIVRVRAFDISAMDKHELVYALMFPTRRVIPKIMASRWAFYQLKGKWGYSYDPLKRYLVCGKGGELTFPTTYVIILWLDGGIVLGSLKWRTIASGAMQIMQKTMQNTCDSDGFLYIIWPFGWKYPFDRGWFLHG